MKIVRKRDIAEMDWLKVLARYPRLIANMIEESLGYFTPHSCVNALKAYKAREYWNCEWYMDIDAKRHDNKILWNDLYYCERIMKINHDVISNAFKDRKYYRNRKSGRHVVEMNLKGHESVGAAWF